MGWGDWSLSKRGLTLPVGVGTVVQFDFLMHLAELISVSTLTVWQKTSSKVVWGKGAEWSRAWLASSLSSFLLFILRIVFQRWVKLRKPLSFLAGELNFAQVYIKHETNQPYQRHSKETVKSIFAVFPRSMGGSTWRRSHTYFIYCFVQLSPVLFQTTIFKRL